MASGSDTVKESSIPNTSNEKKEPNNYKCTFQGCVNVFNRKWKLDRHLCTHTGERPFQCIEENCDKSYQCSSHLQRHIKTAHLRLNRLPCPFPTCASTFSCKSALIKHCKNHIQPRPFACSRCSVTFAKQSKLIRHEKMHDEGSSFSCTVCGSNWTSQPLLKRHMRSHDLKKCEMPGCSFVCDNRNQLRRHEKIEHRVVLICDHCNKTFNNKGILRDHVLIHLPSYQRGVFRCPHQHCNRAYFQMRNLRHHLKAFHDRKRYYCSFNDCQSSFDSQVRLERHVARRHERVEAKEKLAAEMANILPLDELAAPPCSDGSSVLQVIMRDNI